MRKLPKLYQIGIRYPKTVLGTALILTLLAFWSAKNLRIETSVAAMAPKQAESVQNADKYKLYFGGMSYLIMTVEDKDPKTAEYFADEIASHIQKLPAVEYIDYRRPVDFFLKRKWLYLDLEDLNKIKNRLDRIATLEKKGVSLVFSDIMDFADQENRPDLSFQDIFEKYQKKPWVASKYASDESGSLISLRIKVRDTYANIDEARKLVDEIKTIESAIKQTERYQNVAVGYSGSLETTIEESDQIKREMAIVSAVVALALVLIIFFYFKNFESTFLVGIPLLGGVIWTGGLIYLLLGRLNLMTSFAGGILAGLGSDYGIYLLTRYYLERKNGKDFETACRLAFENTGTATYASMVTTAGAFGALLFSHFVVFFEFGLLGALGVVLNYIAMMIVLPSLLVFLRHHKKKRIRCFVQGEGGSFFSSKNKLFTQKPIRVILIAGLLIGLASLSLPSGSRIHFEEDMLVNKNLPGNRLYEKLSRVKGGPLSPTILLTRGVAESDNTVAVLDRLIRQDTSHKLVFDNVLGLSTFVPKQVAEKKSILRQFIPKVHRLRWLPSQEKENFVSSLQESIRSGLVTEENLPVEVIRNFKSPYEKDIYAVYLFPSIDRLSSKALKFYHQAILNLKQQTGFRFIPVDGTFVFDDIIQLIEKEAPKGMILIWVFLGLVLYSLSRSLRRTIITLGNLLGSLILLSGVLWFTHIPLNLMNIATIPIILGTGIDSFIHFAQRYDESQNMSIALREKIPAILFSNLTTIVGFAGMILVSNPGLQSVGLVAVLGLILVTLVCVVIFPRCLLLESQKSR